VEFKRLYGYSSGIWRGFITGAKGDYFLLFYFSTIAMDLRDGVLFSFWVLENSNNAMMFQVNRQTL